jgi:anion-transporting  ArsA/GET3 family ATPase
MRTEQQEVDPSAFEACGLGCKGSLSAMMLDTKRTFDELVERHASSSEVRDRIFANRLYQYNSTSLSGTQEYMAMEKLHAVRADAQWDLIVLDTPPTSNALDFLDAPERLIGAIDSAAMRWFTQAFSDAGKLSFGVIGKGAAALLKALSRFTGAAFLEHVAELVTDLNDLFGGFRDRAREVERALRSPEVAFVLVTSPNPLAMSEAMFFARRLRSSGMHPRACIINGMHELLPEPAIPRDRARTALSALLPRHHDVADVMHRLERALDDDRGRAKRDRFHADRLRAQIGDQGWFAEVPAFEQDIHDLGALVRMAEVLTA